MITFNPLDIVTTVLGLAYILLEYRASVWMWAVGFVMQSLGIVLYYQKGLYADCAMEFYYLAMTVYGWWRWVRKPKTDSTLNPQPSTLNPQHSAITRFPRRLIAPWVAGTLALWMLIYWLLSTFTDSTVPLADSFTTALSLLGIWALAHKYLEQWFIWIAVDVVTCALYFYKELPFKSALYALYVVIAVFGFFKWRRLYRAQRVLLLAGLLLLTLSPKAQPLYDERFYNEADGLPHWNVTQMLQDNDGFIWMGTWNGLCRFDGYTFQSFKPVAGDGCTMPTDRIRNITLADSARIYCQVDDDYYIFYIHTGRFRNPAAAEIPQIAQAMQSSHGRAKMQEGHFVLTDRQGILWRIDIGGVAKQVPVVHPAVPMADVSGQHVRCLFLDRDQRYWVGTRDDGALRLYDRNNRLLGFLGRDGRLHATYTSFGVAVYAMTQQQDGTLWIGTKPGGLFRATELSAGTFRLEHIEGLPGNDIYDLKTDRQGRLWVATFSGLAFLPAGSTVPQTVGVPQRTRFIYITPDNLLLAATTEGLVVGDLSRQPLRFRQHVKEPRRAESLSCNATMDIAADTDGHIYVSTESGGVNVIGQNHLRDSLLSFTHLSSATGFPADVIQTMVSLEKQVLIASNTQLLLYDPQRNETTTFSAHFLGVPCRFSETHPLHMPDGRWLLPTKDGAFTISREQLRHSDYVPPLVLTALSRQSGQWEYAVNSLTSITLQPHERNLSVAFAALDYRAPEQTVYEFRLCDDDADEEPWHNLGHNHSVTLPDMQPGHYQLQLRSTNADGRHTDNLRVLDITVVPTFWESVWGKLFIGLLILGVVATVVYTYLYIRRIKRRQREVLEAYLALLDQQQHPAAVEPVESKTEDPMLQRVMKFIEENIGNSDASVGDMAVAAATSRSGLLRKLKQSMGITPQDLMREARIKYACQLLHQADLTVSDVAYRCGFTDPKYFSRCFKQSVGQSPTDYKNAL